MMATLTVKTASGASAGSVEVSDKVFAIEPNKAVLHQVVTAQLAARRAGSQSTLTRGEVRGGGIKPWRQKGTGRARQGSIRAPHWEGGGVTHAPKPRSYAQRTPKKMVRLALASALSDRASSDRIVVVDSWDFSTPKTKDALKALSALGVDGRILIVLTLEDEIAWRSFRNVPSVHVQSAGELNAYDILVSDYVIFTKNSVPVGDFTVSRGHKPEAEAESPSGSSEREVEVD
ncbi:MAG: 50S ribosomal protein L4 [Acidimicrobiales bacterium]